MRHLGSLVLCLVVGVLVYLLGGISFSKWGEAQTNSGASHYTAVAVMLVAAMAAGGLYGLLMLARLSPIGMVVAGLVFFGVALWSFFSFSSFANVVPNDVLGVRSAGIAAAGPVSLILAMPLLLTVFSPRRWRRWGNAPAAVAPAPGYSPPPVTPSSYQSPAYGQPGSGSPYSAAPPYAPVSPAYGSSDPSSGAGSYAAPGSPVSYPPPHSPYSGGDDPESTRRL
jgi:hypothetical protein